MFRLLAVLGLLSTPALAKKCPESNDEVGFMSYGIAQFYTCARDKAVAFAASGETADNVATAAVSACDVELITAKNIAKDCIGADLGDHMENKMRAEAQRRAIRVVVQKRAGL